jgi:hypothetical protein
MKFLKHIVFLGLLLCAFVGHAQLTVPDYRMNVSYGGTSQDNFRNIEIGANKDVINLLGKRLRLGLGLRLNWNRIPEASYTTALYQLQNTNDQFIDTFSFSQGSFFSGNLYINGEFYLLKKWSIGVNADLLGYGFGSRRRGTFRPGEDAQNAGVMTQKNILYKSTRAAVFDFSNPEGNLTSQLFIRFDPTPRLSLRGGLAISNVELHTPEDRYGPDLYNRFGRRYSYFFGGISIHFLQEEKE